VRHALRASNSDNGNGGWLIPLSPTALRPRFLTWIDSKLESRNPSDGRRIILFISERSVVNDEKGLDKLGFL
jgi:hypothetical protein